MDLLNAETEDTLPILLELAANNDLETFKKYVDQEPPALDGVGLWYGRQKGSNQMVLQHRTPLMVASTYGSIEILKFILSFPEVDVNRTSGLDKSTALHCAASGGSINAVEIVKLLLEMGSDRNLTDSDGFHPVQVIVVPPKLHTVKYSLQMMLSTDIEQNGSPRSPKNGNVVDFPFSPVPEKKEYPTDPTLPDIKNGVYSSDEFRMFLFKVRPCSRAYSHDWTECPFVHPGENARRRDPRKYHYSCVPCPDFRKGACRKSDMCEYAHGVFESWLHPAQYRTRPCKDGINCDRRVCFFAHTQEELRPLYVSTDSFVPSPSSFTPPMSPSANGYPNTGRAGPQHNVPALQLPGSNLLSGRLRSSFNARDVLWDDDPYFFPDNEVSHTMNNHSAYLNDIFSGESSSPRYLDQALGFSPTPKSALLNQFQLSPIRTNFPSRNLDHSPHGRMSPRNPEPISPMTAHLSMLAQRENQFRSDLGSNAVASQWGAPNGSGDWADPGKLKRSSSFDNGEEPDLSWVHSLVKESPLDVKEKSVGPTGEGSGSNLPIEQVDQSVLGAWLEQMQLDQLMAQ